MRLGVVGLESQGLAKARLGRVDLAQRLERDAQIVPRLGQVGNQAEGLLIVVHGLAQALLLLANHAQEEPGFAGLRILPDDLSQHPLGPIQVARLENAAGHRQGLAGCPSGSPVRRGSDDKTASPECHRASPAFRDEKEASQRGASSPVRTTCSQRWPRDFWSARKGALENPPDGGNPGSESGIRQ